MSEGEFKGKEALSIGAKYLIGYLGRAMTLSPDLSPLLATEKWMAHCPTMVILWVKRMSPLCPAG